MNSYEVVKQTRDKVEELVNDALSTGKSRDKKQLLALMKISRLGAGDFFLRTFYDACYKYSWCIDEAVKNVLKLESSNGSFGMAKVINFKLKEYIANNVPKDNNYFNSLPPCLQDTIRNYYYNTPEYRNMKRAIRSCVKKAFSGMLTESIEKWYIDHNEWSEGE